MRVISGKYKGRKLLGNDIIGTRPTMDRIKESLFSMIQTKIKNSICLDLFAGSGSLGIEALSNGAKCCYFIDRNDEVIKILKENTHDIDGVNIIKNDYKTALNEFKKSNITFDIIFLDPPYKDNLIKVAISKILEFGLLNNKAIVVCEYESEVINVDLKLLKERKYGSKKIKIYEFDNS